MFFLETKAIENISSLSACCLSFLYIIKFKEITNKIFRFSGHFLIFDE